MPARAGPAPAIRRSLRTDIFVAFLVAALLPWLVTGWVMTTRSDARLRAQALDDVRIAGRLARAVVDERGRRLLANAQLIAQAPLIRQAVLARDRPALLAEARAFMAGLGGPTVAVVDAQGVALVHAHLPDRSGEDVAAALKGLQRALSGQPGYSTEIGGLRGLALRGFAPIEVDGRIAGAIIVTQNLDQEFLASIREATDFETFAVLSDGSTMGAVPEPTVLGAIQRQGQEFAAGGSVNGHDRAVYAWRLRDPAGDTVGFLGIVTTFDHLEVARAALLQTTIAGGLAAALAAASLAWLLSRFLVSPVKRITQAAHAIAGGKTEEIPQLGDPVELADLSHSLTVMVSRLGEQTHRLAEQNVGLVQTEAALRQSEERFRRLAENAQDIIYRYDLKPTRRYSYVSPVAGRIVGYTPEEHYADPDLPLKRVHPEYRAAVEALYGGRDVPREFIAPIRHKDGHFVWLERHILPIYDGDGTLMAIEGIARDVTERKRAEAERAELIREQSARVAAEATQRRALLLAEASRVFAEASLELQPVLDTIARRVVELIGDACLIRLVSPDGAWLTPVALYHGDPDALAVMRQILSATPRRVDEGLHAGIIRNGRPLLIPTISPEQLRASTGPENWRHLDSGQIPRTHSMLIVPLRARGAVIGTLGVSRDRTERPYAADDQELLQDLADRAALAIENARLYRDVQATLAELQQTQQQLIQQERLHALGQMASGIAHDFNNALVPILGFSELLLLRPEYLSNQARATEFLRLINTGARDAASVVGRLREFYRARAAGEVPQPVALNAVVEQVIELTQPRWRDQAQARGVTIAMETDLAEVPAIAGSETELREVLTNLIFNAVDAMPASGTIALRTRARETTVVLEVSDTGTGMTEEVRKRCLEPFFTTKGERGTGLGLSMVYGIVRRHGGTIAVESAPGQGTTITVEMPVMTEPAAPAPQERGPEAMRVLRVLVVDDEAMVRRVIAEFLTVDHHTVETAGGGLDALEKLQAGPFDLVVTDRAMPGMSGDQLAVAVKDASPSTRVIMLTGFGELMRTAGESPAGVDCTLSKPVTLAALRQAIASVVTSSTWPMPPSP